MLRSIKNFTKQGSKPPWRLYPNYARDIVLIKRAQLDDGVLEFSGSRYEQDASAEPVVAAAA